MFINIQNGKDTFGDIPVNMNHILPKITGTALPSEWIKEAKKIGEQEARKRNAVKVEALLQ